MFAELDLDHSGLLSASEIKIGLRRMGVPFVTNAHVVKMIAEFDDNGDNAISESEFIDHYGKLFERRDSSIVGRIVHYLVFHPPGRVSQLRSQRFVERFRCVQAGEGVRGLLLRTLLPRQLHTGISWYACCFSVCVSGRSAWSVAYPSALN